MFGPSSAQATFGRLFGVFPIEVAADGHRPSTLGKAASGLWTFAALAVAALGPFVVRATFEGARHFSGGVLWALLVAVVTSALAVAANILWALKNADRTANLFTKVGVLKPQVIPPSKDQSPRLHLLVLFDTLRAVGEALRLAATLQMQFSPEKVAYWLLFCVIHLAPLAIDMQIWALSLFLEKGFGFINDGLKNVIVSGGASKKNSDLFWKRLPMESRVSDLRRLHADLRTLASEVNDRYGLDMLVTIVMGRLLVVLFLYAMVATLLRGQLPLAPQNALLEAHLALGVLAAFARVYALCHRFQRVASEAATALDHLQRLSVEKFFDHRVSEEVHIFSMQVQSCPVQFTALGFFPLDIALISSIVGTVMTYLVILIQFESGDGEKT
ncbi:gustatory receptor 68a-like [Neocloeon triangulifer]|uniref:gustatory receptor 68a-like n=1 Tax=Neocloeon triangulifer TaxID=2078957 RepID=UPI00286F2A3C|nr:gustatory receptor 68a-like [Neocloeon triangulifer]